MAPAADDTPYPIAEETLPVLDAWLAEAHPDGERMAVLNWLMRLMGDPTSVDAVAVPTLGLPEYSAIVPGSTTGVGFMLVKSPPYDPAIRGIYLRRIKTLTEQ